MIGQLSPVAWIAPEWWLAGAIAATGWRLRPLPSRSITTRQPKPTDATTSAGAQRHATAPALTRLRHLSERPRRRRPIDASQAAAWCDGIARSLRSGATLSAAIVDAPRSAAIDAAVGATILGLQRGGSTLDAVDRIHREATSSHLVLVATVLRTVATHGGSAAEPVDRAASVLRQRAAAEAERVTHSAQARMSARVMTLLPLAMLAVVSVTSGSVRSALTTPVGALTVTVGLGCNLVGWWWMRRIIAGGQP